MKGLLGRKNLAVRLKQCPNLRECLNSGPLSRRLTTEACLRLVTTSSPHRPFVWGSESVTQELLRVYSVSPRIGTSTRNLEV